MCSNPEYFLEIRNQKYHRKRRREEKEYRHKITQQEKENKSIWLSIDDLFVSKDQIRKCDPHKIEKHRQDIEAGKPIFPIDVVPIEIDGKIKYRVLGNGRHRFLAAKEAGIQTVPVYIHGSREDLVA